MTIATANRRVAQYLIAIAIVSSAVLVLSALLIVPYLTTNKLLQSDNLRKIIAFETRSVPTGGYDENGQPMFDTTADFKYVKVEDLEPNSFAWVLNPFDNIVANELYGKKPLASFSDQDKKEVLQKIDRYAYYNLVRLPEWLGGGKNDASAYRAYSGISLTQKCLARYWPQEGRMRLEDPCAGDIYRPWDGLATGGPAGSGFEGGFTASQGKYQGLATLNLSVDAGGYVLAQRPDIAPHANGIAGEGRVFSIDQIEKSSDEMVAEASAYVGYNLPFGARLSGYQLGDISPDYRFENSYGMNTDERAKAPFLQASYSTSKYYEGITITVAPVDRFPSLAVDNVTKKTTDGTPAPDPNNSELRELLLINSPSGDQNCYYSSQATNFKIPYSVKYGSEIAGKYAILHAPYVPGREMHQSFASREDLSCGSQALVWGKSVNDNRDLVVWIQTRDYDLDQLIGFAKSLPFR